MSKQPTYDLPPASSNGSQPLLLDANAGNYSTLPNGGGIVFIERYAIRKPFVRRQAINTTSNIRPETYLVKETNYTDVGGGWFEFERHYAEVPATWFEFRELSISGVSATTVTRQEIPPPLEGQDPLIQLTFTYRTIINSDNTDVRLPVFARRNNFQASVVAKATKTYFLESQIESVIIRQPQSQVSVSSISIIEGQSEVDTSSIVVPEAVVAPDEINLHMGKIYERTRFTASLTIDQITVAS